MVASLDILVVGGGGQVGLELQRLSLPKGVFLSAPTRGELDITDEASVKAMIAARSWGAVINTAAYTAVDKAETEIAEAWRINALAPAILAQETARAKIPLVQVSTDYVFDGQGQGFYEAHDPVAPIGVYGASKEGGEQAVRTANPRHAIVRTAWVVSAHRANFVKTMLRFGAERDEMSVVADQIGCPTIAGDLAGALLTIAVRLARDPAAPTGTYHFVNGGETSWHGFAQEIFAQASAKGLKTPGTLKAIATVDYPTPARRPANSRLSTTRLAADYGITPRPWQAALADVMAELT